MHPGYIATVASHALSFWCRANIATDHDDDERLGALDNAMALLRKVVDAKRDGLKRGRCRQDEVERSVRTLEKLTTARDRVGFSTRVTDHVWRL